MSYKKPRVSFCAKCPQCGATKISKVAMVAKFLVARACKLWPSKSIRERYKLCRIRFVSPSLVKSHTTTIEVE